MKNRSRVFLITPLMAVTLFSIGCKPQTDTSAGANNRTVGEQLDAVVAATTEATDHLLGYSYARKDEFVAAMEGHLTRLEGELNEISASIRKSSNTVQAEANPKLLALRTKVDSLNGQLETVKGASADNWEGVKGAAHRVYHNLEESAQETRQWLSEKLAP
ncbi:MAG: hypothetical protein JJT96_14965 [Opitutales bacterium]|nr:hypothetical protein [Opitutales bacterium]